MTEKPHKGRILNWYTFALDKEMALKKYPHREFGMGYVIIGQFDTHPQFAGQHGRTSLVLSHDAVSGEIETLNSRYTLVGPDFRTVYEQVKAATEKGITT